MANFEIMEQEFTIDTYISYPIFSNSFIKILEKVKELHNCPIATYLLSDDFEYSDEVRFINNVSSAEVTYTQKGKELLFVDGKIQSKNRVRSSVSRTIRKCMTFPDKFSTREYELFNNYYVSTIEDSKYRFEIVSGSDITRYYLGDNYLTMTGQLGNSCMRYDKCQDYFSIYENNARMVVMFDNEEEGDLIIGRAILWENVHVYVKSFDGTYEKHVVDFMDRIYTISDSLVENFKIFAKKNGFFVKSSQCNSSNFILIKDDIKFNNPIVIKEDVYITGEVPYLDSLINIFSNSNIMDDCDDEYMDDDTYEFHPSSFFECRGYLSNYIHIPSCVKSQIKNSDTRYVYSCRDTEGAYHAEMDQFDDREVYTNEFTSEDFRAYPDNVSEIYFRGIYSDVLNSDIIELYDGSEGFRPFCVKIHGEWYDSEDNRIIVLNDGEIAIYDNPEDFVKETITLEGEEFFIYKRKN